MPLYLARQPLLVGHGWFVVPFQLAIAARFTLLCGGWLMLSVGLVEVLIRRVELLRSCFGLSTRH